MNCHKKTENCDVYVEYQRNWIDSEGEPGEQTFLNCEPCDADWVTFTRFN